MTRARAQTLRPIVGLVFRQAAATTDSDVRRQVNAAAAQIKVQLQRRADSSQLVETVKAYAKQERTVFTEVASPGQARRAVQSGDLQQCGANRQLTAPLGRLLAIAENYPQLKSNENSGRCRTSSRGPRTASPSRQDYNEAVNRYNAYHPGFPQV